MLGDGGVGIGAPAGTQLECTGCIYRYIENDKDAPGSPQATWSYCCPCVYYMAREFPWMAVEC